MRLFIALDIDEGIRERIVRFMEGVSGFAPDARWAKPESLHVTLKFIGEQPEPMLEEIKSALGTLAAGEVALQFRGYGFFPTAKAPRVFWVGIEAGPDLPTLAAAVDQQTARLGIPKEERGFSPHLTLARGSARGTRSSGSPHRNKEDRPNHSFQRLQEKLAALSTPEFGTMTAHEFFLYQSEVGRDGSRYTKLSRFGLK
ncbi:MAG: RNA 2',3'-cyclic phosphodiesterase [Candidatus Sulfotelmatobacter sp.]